MTIDTALIVPHGRPIIVFDVLCAVCSANAPFIQRSERRDIFRLALIARNRYRIFGKRETCWMLTLAQRARVL